MENKIPVNSGLGSGVPAQLAPAAPNRGTSNANVPLSAFANLAPPGSVYNPPKRRSRTGIIAVVVLLLLLAATVAIIALMRPKQDASQSTSQLGPVEIPLTDFFSPQVLGAHSLVVNGSLRVNEAFVVAPSLQPATATPGQIYYDQTSNELAYYNGTEFVALNAGTATTTVTNTGVASLGGLSGTVGLGAGLTTQGGLLQNTGVLNIQAGSGINVSNNGGVITVSGGGGNNGYVQGGNSFGATAVLGTTDANDLNFIANNTSVMKLTIDNKVSVNGLLSLSSPYSQDQFSIRNDAADSTLNMGANIIGNPSNDGGQDRNLNYIQASKFNSGPGGTIDKLRVFFTIVDNANPHFKVAVYSNNAGAPQNLLSNPAAASTVAGAANTWSEAPLGGTITLAPNTDYWLALSTETDGTWYARQEGGVNTTKYQSGFLFTSNFPATYTVTETESRYMSIYAPYISITDQSSAISGLTFNENNEMAIRPLFNSDTTFGITDAAGTSLVNVNAFEGYVGLRKLMIGGADTNYSAFIRSSTPSGVMALWRDTNIETDNIMQFMSNIGGAGTVQLRITADGSIRMGNVDATGALLVLDSKNTAGDPTVVDGAMYYSSATNSMRCAQGGLWVGCVGGLVAVNTSIPAGNTIASTTAETDFASNWSMPANYCVAGRTIRWTAQGTYSTTGTPTLTLRLKAGTTNLAVSPAITTGNGVTDREWRLEGQTICNAAPTGTSATETQGIVDLFTSSTAATPAEMVNTTTTNLATNGALTLQVSGQWSAASSSNTVTLRQFIVEAIGP